MSECGFRIYRGKWFMGPCRLEAEHDGWHDTISAEDRAAELRMYLHSLIPPREAANKGGS